MPASRRRMENPMFSQPYAEGLRTLASISVGTLGIGLEQVARKASITFLERYMRRRGQPIFFPDLLELGAILTPGSISNLLDYAKTIKPGGTHVLGMERRYGPPGPTT